MQAEVNQQLFGQIVQTITRQFLSCGVMRLAL